MNLFDNIRKAFGQKTEPQQDLKDLLVSIEDNDENIKQEIQKAQESFNKADFELDLKIKACKKVPEGEAVIPHLKSRQLNNIKQYTNTVDLLNLKQDDIQKGLDFIKTEILIKSHGSYEGHYANAIVRKWEKDSNGKNVCKILFLKRAPDKVIEPNKYCLPGGHIEENETIEQATLRELKEEANLLADNANILGKIKCLDGKWAFYSSVWAWGDLALLDGENTNAHWMSEEEWKKEDLLFDLKEHLEKIECKEKDRIIEVVKAEDLDRESEKEINSIKEEILKKAEVILSYAIDNQIDTSYATTWLHNYRNSELFKGIETIDYLYHVDRLMDDLLENQAFSELNEVEKGSFVSKEGIRGGKVIGHTKSGKPIYETPKHPGHDRFNRDDHRDAYVLHKKRAESTKSDTNRYMYMKYAGYHADKWGIQKGDYIDNILIDTADDYENGNTFPFGDEEFAKGGKRAKIGEHRTWGGIEYVKTQSGWVKAKKSTRPQDQEKEKPAYKHSTDELLKHAENTSYEQLEKVAANEKYHPHVRDAAKRELERRGKKEIKTDFQYTPSDTLSSDKHKEIEKRFGEHLAQNYEKARSEYKEKFGNVINTDNARELSDDYLKNKSELSAAVHEPASAFTKKMYEDELSSKTPKGKRDLVYFTAGGTGSGKTSSLMGAEKSFHEKAHIVYDTNMNGFSSAKKKIDQALEAGKKIRINYTFRDPIDAFENGAVPRSIRIGRTVPIEEHIKTHLGSMDAIQALQQHYKDNKNVKIVVTNNSLGKGGAKQVPISFVKNQEKNYIASDLREKLHKINDSLYEQGKISKSHYVGFKG